MRALLLLGLVACGPSALELADEPPVEVRTAIDGTITARGGHFEVVVEHDEDVAVAWPEIPETRLEVTQDGELREERVGDRVITTGYYVFTGKKGSYVVPSVYVRYELAGEPHVTASQPLYVDLGVEPPRPGELADIAAPPSQWPFPWWLLITMVSVIGLFIAGLIVAFRNGVEQEITAVPPEPPDVVALRAWEAIRAAEDLSDYDKALGISRIYREYAETVLSFKATALTTTEILDRLRRMVHLEEGNIPRSKRLLRATDRIKFAEVSAQQDLFDALDADLRAFVDSTRPHHWVPEVPEARKVVEKRRGLSLSASMLNLNWFASVATLGGAVATLLATLYQARAGAMPMWMFMGALMLASALLLIAAVHGALASEKVAKRLKWLQILVALPYLVLVPIGTLYGVFALFFTLFSASGKTFYRREAA